MNHSLIPNPLSQTFSILSLLLGVLGVLAVRLKRGNSWADLLRSKLAIALLVPKADRTAAYGSVNYSSFSAILTRVVDLWHKIFILNQNGAIKCR
ncbi:MAG TPA: hypothetical protein DD990_28810 [Cyanobacteria bacterium UBA11368]|nr:hypothetical protein [Cyanobacteria bacterium UBA11368]